MNAVRSMRLKDLLLETKDGDWGQSDPAEGLVPYHVIRATDFASASLGDVQSVPLRFLPSHTVQRRTIQLNDVLIETAGGSPGRPTGRTMLITQGVLDSFDGPVTCASFARFLRPDPDQIDPRYLYWFLKSLYQSGEIEQYQVQHTGVARFQYTQFAANQQVPLPERSAQQGISEVLGVIDEKIAANTKLAELTAGLATAEFSRAYRDAINVVRLSELVSTQYGVTTSAHGAPGPKFLRVTDINKKPWIEWENTPNCTVSDLELGKYRVSPGDILVARMADPGKAAFIDHGDPESVFASYLVRLKPHDATQALYIYYFLRSPRYSEYAEGAMTGSVQKNMNAKVIVAADIALPAAGQIMQFNETVGALRMSIQSLLRENRTLIMTRDAILPQLMSGKLQVRNAEKVLQNAGV